MVRNLHSSSRGSEAIRATFDPARWLVSHRSIYNAQMGCVVPCRLNGYVIFGGEHWIGPTPAPHRSPARQDDDLTAPAGCGAAAATIQNGFIGTIRRREDLNNLVCARETYQYMKSDISPNPEHRQKTNRDQGSLPPRRAHLKPNKNKVSDGGHRRKTIRRECVTIALGIRELDEIQEGACLA